MLKDIGRVMSVSAKGQSSVTPPVLLCRLCHCEFTNFKEHVKSLVHLDARETKTTTKPPTKNKASFEDGPVNVKKVKTDISSEQSSSDVSNEVVDKTDDNKESTSSENKRDSPIDSKLLYTPFDDEEDEDEDYADLNGTASLKTKDDVPENQNEAVVSTKCGNDKDEEVASKDILPEKQWHCKLCDHVQHADDESFDEHARDKVHVESLACKPLSSRQTSREIGQCPWLIICSACAFETNDKAQFISHLQTEQHDDNVKNILKNARMECKNGASKDHNRECESESKVPETNAKSIKKDAPSTEPKHTNSKSVTRQAETNKSTIGRAHQGKGLGSSAPRGGRHNPSKTSPKPLMSLSLQEISESWIKNKPGWKSTSALPRSRSPTNKPGILGEYKPDFHPNNVGREVFNRDGRLGRSSDLRSTDRQDYLHSRVGPNVAVGRPPYLDVNPRDSVSLTTATSARTDSFTGLRGSDRYNSVWAERPSLALPTEPLNPLTFDQSAQDQARHFILANLLSRTGISSSSVSLDLASNSSFRLKHDSERDMMRENYSSSRYDVSRTDFPRSDLSRTKSSTLDHYSRPMFSRR